MDQRAEASTPGVDRFTTQPVALFRAARLLALFLRVARGSSLTFNLRLIAEHHAQQGTVNFNVAVVINKTQFPEFVHEKTHARSRRADLVVMQCMRKRKKLRLVVCKPWCLLWQDSRAAFEFLRLNEHTNSFAVLRLDRHHQKLDDVLASRRIHSRAATPTREAYPQALQPWIQRRPCQQTLINVGPLAALEWRKGSTTFDCLVIRY